MEDQEWDLGMERTNDQRQVAFRCLRQAMYDRLSLFSFTQDMLESRSVFQLLCLLQLLAGHRNWIGQFTDTVWALDQIFGYDAIREELKEYTECETIVNEKQPN